MLAEPWWVGPRSPVLETWDVETYPPLVVIDHEGVIRHRQGGYDPSTARAAEVVRELVRRAEAKRR
jgi:hypothetical protein